MGPGTSQRDNTLVISQAREEDQGYYLCEGTVDNVPVANVYVFVEIESKCSPKMLIVNNLNLQKIYLIFALLIVCFHQLIHFIHLLGREPPVVEIWPQAEQAVPLGAQFEFRCQIKGGIPEPYITWDRNGGRQLSPHVQIQPQNVLRFVQCQHFGCRFLVKVNIIITYNKKICLQL